MADYDFKAPRERLQLKGHSGEVASIDFHPAGRFLASGGDDHDVRVWDLDERRGTHKMARHGAAINAVRFHPGGELLGSLDRHGVVFFLKFPEMVVFWSHTLVVGGGKGDLRFAPDGRSLAVAGSDGRIVIVEVPGGKPIASWQAHPRAINALAFHPGSGLLASAGTDATIRIWELPTGRERRVLERHSGQVLALDFSPNGRQLASGSLDKAAFVWDHASGELLREYHLHAGFVTACRFHPRAGVLATGSNDSTLKFWDVEQPGARMIGNLKRLDWSVRELAFDPKGRLMAAASTEALLRVWDLRQREVTAVRQAPPT
jgi:WD40 repeat protein